MYNNKPLHVNINSVFLLKFFPKQKLMRPVALFYIFISLFNVGQFKIGWILLFASEYILVWHIVSSGKHMKKLWLHTDICNWNGRNILLAFLVTVDILGIISKFNSIFLKVNCSLNRKLSTFVILKLHCSILRLMNSTSCIYHLEILVHWVITDLVKSYISLHKFESLFIY